MSRLDTGKDGEVNSWGQQPGYPEADIKTEVGMQGVYSRVTPVKEKKDTGWSRGKSQTAM